MIKTGECVACKSNVEINSNYEDMSSFYIYATYFTVTNTEAIKCWEFDMKNSNMTGHWTGKFAAKGNTTEVEFIEEVNVKNIIMKLFVKGYLKRQQATFIADLKKHLG